MSEREVEFLVVVAGRGGTSLLAGLLDYHPALSMGLEYESDHYLIQAEPIVQRLGRTRRQRMRNRAQRFYRACQNEASRHANMF